MLAYIRITLLFNSILSIDINTFVLWKHYIYTVATLIYCYNPAVFCLSIMQAASSSFASNIATYLSMYVLYVIEGIVGPSEDLAMNKSLMYHRNRWLVG